MGFLQKGLTSLWTRLYSLLISKSSACVLFNFIYRVFIFKGAILSEKHRRAQSSFKDEDIKNLQVLPGLYLGSFRDGKDPEQLRDNQITHIVSIHDTAKEVVEDKQYLCIRVSDSPDENLTKYFARCNDFIHNARMGGGSVLVHCLAGVSRSATIAAAYIMSVTSLNCKDALKVVRGARNIANPNYGFHSQLKEFESYSLTSERKRLKIRYSAFDNQKSDEEECAKMITVYHSSIPSSTSSTPTRSFSKPSTSANTTPLSSPFHRLRQQKKCRSASSSPKR